MATDRRAGGAADEAGPRRQAREAALQVLYAVDCLPESSPEATERALRQYWLELDGPPPGRAYCEALVRGVASRREALDDALRAASPNWRLERMARVDRNVLRLAAWEILYGAEVPAQVAIDEAVELARTFGAEGAYAFVNGILDKMARGAKRL